MKIFSFKWAFLILIFSSCGNKTAPELRSYVSFQMPGHAGSFFLIRLDSLGNTYRREIKTDESGLGVSAMILDQPEEIVVEPTGYEKRVRLYISPGDSIVVKSNPSGREFFEISGSHSERQQQLLLTDTEFALAKSRLTTLPSEKFDSALEAYYYYSVANLKKDEGQIGFDTEFIATQKLTSWAYASYILINKKLGQNEKEIPPTIGFKDSLMNYHPEYARNFAYSNMIQNYQYMLTNLVLSDHPELEMDYDGNLALSVDYVEQMDVDPEIRQWLAALMLSGIQYFGTEGPLGQRYREFVDSKDTHEGWKLFLQEYSSIWENILPGMPAPDFNVVTTAGDTIRISQYFGRSLYIDVWASWCGPCLAEFPFSREMMNDPQLDKMEYLFISIDYTKVNWEKGMEKHPMPGVQLYAVGDWKSEMAEKYNITGLPRYIMIDSKGNIIRANAPRPSRLDEIKKIVSNSLQASE